MTPQEYERLTELFHAALGMAAEDREAFLSQLSPSDASLRIELQSLLAVHSVAISKNPPDDIAAGYLAQSGEALGQAPSFAPNTHLNRFVIRSLLGKGGMGEVYLAEDVRLHRMVALKILPPNLLKDQNRMRRFEQEATAAAALNHPHIAHVYEIGESEQAHFIVMEHIDGDTLRNRIHRDKDPLPVLLRYLTQVATGLAKAHEAGIVHRDLKPDNIMIARDGYAKILDFGLAKLVDANEAAAPVRGPSSNEETNVAGHNSIAGMVMGTAGYMPPEQAQGRINEIDHRSDIFSFGCILFEAVNGRRPSLSESVVADEADPSTNRHDSLIRRDLQRIVERCLAREPAQRYQNIRDVIVELKDVRNRLAGDAELERISQLSDSSGRETIRQSNPATSHAEYIGSLAQRKYVPIVTVAIVVVALVAIGWLMSRKLGNPGTSIQPVTIKRLTPDIYAIDPALSPKGEYLAYVRFEKGKRSIWLKDLASGNDVETMSASFEDGYAGLQFSPDGKQMYYLTNRNDSPNGTIVRIPLWGGTPQPVANNSMSLFAVSPDGQQLGFVRGLSLVIASTEQEAERELLTLSGGEGFVGWGSQLSWSPDSTRIAIAAVQHAQGKDKPELIDVSVADGTRRIVPIPEWSELEDVAWMADGASLLVTAREKEGDSLQIWKVAYPAGETTRVTTDSNSYDGLSLTADSHTLIAEQIFTRQNIWLASISDTGNTKQLTTSAVGADGYSGLAITDDNRIVFTSPRSGNVDLWTMNEDGGEQQQLTANAGNLNKSPRLTPDGRYIVFASSRSGTRQIWRMDRDGRNQLRLTRGTDPEDLPFPSADSQWVYYVAQGGDKALIMKVSINGGESVPGNVYAWDAVPSPDGKLLACGVYLDQLKNPWQVAITSTQGGEPLKLLDILPFRGVKRWTNDSKSLIYINGATAELWQQPIDGSPPTKLFTLSNERLYNFDISPDFQRIAYSLGNESSEAVLISNFRHE